MTIIKTSPKAFIKALKTSVQYAMAAPLTEMAVVGKKTAPDQIAKAMTLRSKSFISSSLRYQKASKGRLLASYGMIERERFTGLVAQEKGETKSKRAPTMKSRGGTLSRRVAPKFRLKKGVKIKSAKRSFSRSGQMMPNRNLIAKLRKTRYKGLFYLPNEFKQPRGIYRFKDAKGKLELIHAIGDIPRQERRKWMEPTNKEIIRSGVGAKKWSSTMNRYMSDRIRRFK